MSDPGYLKKRILEEAYITQDEKHAFFLPYGKKPSWYFDFRRVLFDRTFLEHIAEAFWESTPVQDPVQIGGLESASLPLIAACVLKGEKATGFYIRKSRKKKMEMKQIEGVLSDAPIILVDDLINSGSSFKKQVEILEREGKRVSALWCIVRFRELDEYDYFINKGIKVVSLFSLKDLGLSMLNKEHHLISVFERQWYFGPSKPHLLTVEPKPQPIVHDGHVYTLSDSGYAWCLKQKTGEVVWKRKLVWWVNAAHTTFISPVLCRGVLYVGSVKGTVYALDCKTGKVVHFVSCGDAIRGLSVVEGALIVLSRSHQKDYVQRLSQDLLELSWRIQLGISASAEMSATSVYILIGDEKGGLIAISTKNGKVKWQSRLPGAVHSKGTLYRNWYMVYGCDDGSWSLIDIRNGTVVYAEHIGEWLFGTPALEGDLAYFSGLDSYVHAVNLLTHQVLWRAETKGRIFSSPIVSEGKVYVGNNEGVLYTYDAASGKLLDQFFVTERITNPVVLIQDNVLLPTFAGELYFLKKKA